MKLSRIIKTVLLVDFLTGLVIAVKEIFKAKKTLNYPFEKGKISPRYRYDQLMRLGWKVFLPLSLTWIIITSSVVIYLQN